MLKFDDHVTEICKKASKQLAVLKRLGSFLTKQGKLVIYDSFISSNFSYCPLAWHFCSIASTNNLEKVQERALRFINNDYSSSLKKLLSRTKTEPLHVKRLKIMACEVFKIVNKLSPEYIQNMISIKTSTYNFRGERKADIPRVNTTRYGLRSFRSEAHRIWNSLSNNLLVAESYPQFRGLLRRWDGLGCGCPLCFAQFFFFAFLLMSYRALLCFTGFALLFLLCTINFIHYPILLYTCALEMSRPSSPVRQDGERRTTFLDEYAFRRVPFFTFWLIFLCAYL